jgi:hypothetical protein
MIGGARMSLRSQGIPPSVLPDSFPSRGEINSREGLACLNVCDGSGAGAPSQSPHLWGRWPAGQRGAFSGTDTSGFSS